ncbi:hypothetical protein KYC5002_10690 [Archangium violaceum]|uniref:hypothetical protein n=1 Tax=Archangium violaceum TaxID=83451 RepID=UPI002B2E212C|nr:hypothetical protein KYC5002_10690 [Archangium gephyra]
MEEPTIEDRVDPTRCHHGDEEDVDGGLSRRVHQGDGVAGAEIQARRMAKPIPRFRVAARDGLRVVEHVADPPEVVGPNRVGERILDGMQGLSEVVRGRPDLDLHQPVVIEVVLGLEELLGLGLRQLGGGFLQQTLDVLARSRDGRELTSGPVILWHPERMGVLIIRSRVNAAGVLQLQKRVPMRVG